MVFNLFRFLKKPAIIVAKGEGVSYNEDLSFPTNFARSVSNMTKTTERLVMHPDMTDEEWARWDCVLSELSKTTNLAPFCSGISTERKFESDVLPYECTNMTKMPDHIAEQIKKTESYIEELQSLQAESLRLQMEVLHLEMRPVRESWPSIYMLCKCVKSFTKSRYDEEFECDREYKVEVGKDIIFRYDYTDGVFKEDSNFSSDFSLFTYVECSENFEVIKYGNSIDEVLNDQTT